MAIVNSHFATVQAKEGEDSAQLLADIAAVIGQCRRCALCEGRTNVVPGFGNPAARVMLIGEAPGKNEDLQGRPFVGAAGHNRDPHPDEIATCTPYLRDQVRAIGPEFLVTMGNFSTKFILKTERGITRLHGQVTMAGRFKVFPVYHPAAALYDPTKQVAIEADFRRLGELLKG